MRAWAKQIGTDQAMARLIARGMNPRTAQMLCLGEYGSKPKAYRNMLLEEMSKDGFAVSAAESA